jgi:3-hydroxyacyl-CoA dehydrogenase/3a,7a,12a-trihydroxy-5b-cholest-24-enoyl-CoA hydratase
MSAPTPSFRRENIDVDRALAYEFQVHTSTYGERELVLYALGVGAEGEVGSPDLRYAYEKSLAFSALPTFGAAVALKVAFAMSKHNEVAPGLPFGLDRILHTGHFVRLARPLPPLATLHHRTKIKDVFDQGRHAVVVTAITSYDASGGELIYNEVTTLVRGAGGWGGRAAPDERDAPMDRAPDAVIEQKTAANQALLYRLSGDENPLHVDPDFARAFGFPKPMLHGLCTLGFAGRHVIRAMLGNDVRVWQSLRVQFSEAVFPGETLVTEMWKHTDGTIRFRCKTKDRDKVVLSGGVVELFATLRTPDAPAMVPTPHAVKTLAEYVAANPDLASRVRKTFLFRLRSPDSAWLLDLKHGAGEVRSAAWEQPADCTLDMTETDFARWLVKGGDVLQWYFAGSLRVEGDIRACRHLLFDFAVEKNGP